MSPSAHHEQGAIAGLSLAMLLPALGTSIANVALPTLADAFQASFQAVQWVVLAYLLVTTTLVVSAGRLGDMLGRRRLLIAGTLVYALASLLCAAAPSLGWLLAARALQGAGAALMMALTMAIASATLPPGRTGRAMGLLGTTSAIGTALGPSLGGALIGGFGWPAVFLAGAPLGVLTALLLLKFVPADALAATPDLRRFDLPGTLWLALALASYALAMTAGGPSPAGGGLLWLAAAALGLAFFVRAERRSAAPLIGLAAIRDRGLRAGLAVSAAGAIAVMATLVVGPFYLANAFGLDPLRAGLVMSIGPVVAALAGVPAGRLVERLGTVRTTHAGLGAMALAAALIALPVAGGLAAYVAPLALLTAGYALAQAANSTAVMAGAPAERRGVVSGLLNLSRNLGLITGASLMGAVFAAGAGTTDFAAAPPAVVAAGMRATFSVAALLLLGAIALMASSRTARQAAAAEVAS